MKMSFLMDSVFYFILGIWYYTLNWAILNVSQTISVEKKFYDAKKVQIKNNQLTWIFMTYH